ncbi:endonuclease/exonuclease/phosphatase family protein [Luteimonas sp. MHLX1A]|uniref:endonuclease/exonuclease/phosphatase family protein n=1 Tax=Alterluteimonas muca TaxID=2878684 RepID=UPI001E4B7A0A|nr:endonuclease/exonuclease/phosphatase family protein [Luteimonas sp. MHLX1A]MCD9046112.1 endonuclease/exonuclease/phosphatase family protein [Luteimonas sp. MHLX1A]
MMRLLLLPVALVLLAGCVRVNVHGDPAAYRRAMSDSDLRVATYNASLYADTAGGLVARLANGDADARKVAAVLQRVRPDVVLINEFDFDPDGRAADLFQRDYLEVAQPGGGAALRYPYRYFAPVNTGVASGLDLDGDGQVGAEGRAYGNDAWGYGLHPGQYGMLLLSRHPIDGARARTFQHLRWSALPDARRPVLPDGRPFHADAVWSQLRLSSKSHWDVPVRTPLGTVHMLASHPTPPVFDGPEDRNGRRNADEIRLWREYISPGAKPWLCDDAGACGGLPGDARFVILGDLNNDPADGDGLHEAVNALLGHPRVVRHPTPSSAGALAAARAAPAVHAGRGGNPAHGTGDFGGRVGVLRLDYALPSTGMRLAGTGVYWPAPGEPGADLVDGSDHRLVWVDLAP